MLLISNLFFFLIFFFLSQMDTNHIYRWTAIISPWKTMLLIEITVGGPNFLLVDCSWTISSNPTICLSGQSKPSSVCVHHAALVLNSPPPPSRWLPGKATEESWAEGGFCMLVKKNNLCQRKVLQQLCCKTCTFQGWASILDFFVPVDLSITPYYY